MSSVIQSVCKYTRTSIVANFVLLSPQVDPATTKLIVQVFDENRITRDDFLGMVELSLRNLPRESDDEEIRSEVHHLQPRR